MLSGDSGGTAFVLSYRRERPAKGNRLLQKNFYTFFSQNSAHPLTKPKIDAIMVRHNDELCYELNMISQFGSASRGSGGSSVQIRRNHHYRNRMPGILEMPAFPSRNTHQASMRRYVQSHTRVHQRFWI